MSAIFNSLNVHNFPISQPILMKLVSKFMVYRALSDKTYLLSGLLSPLIYHVISLLPRRHALSSLLIDKNGYQTVLNKKTGS